MVAILLYPGVLSLSVACLSFICISYFYYSLSLFIMWVSVCQCLCVDDCLSMYVCLYVCVCVSLSVHLSSAFSESSVSIWYYVSSSSHSTGLTLTNLVRWWSLLHRACCMPACPCRSSRSGPPARRTWYHFMTVALTIPNTQFHAHCWELPRVD